MSGSITASQNSDLNTLPDFSTVSGLDLSADLVFYAFFDFFFLLLVFLIAGTILSSKLITSSRGGKSESKIIDVSETFSDKSSMSYSTDSTTDDAMEASSPPESTSDFELSDSSEMFACS